MFLTIDEEPRSARRARKPEAKRRGRPDLAAAVLGQLLDPTLRRQGFADSRLVTDWRTIVGEELARDTLPLKLERRHRTLTLRVEPSAALLVQHDEPRLLERINDFFGTTLALRLRIVQGSVPRAPSPTPPVPLSAEDEAAIAEAVETVEPAGLRGSLAALGRAVRQRRRAREQGGATSALEAEGREA